MDEGRNRISVHPDHARAEAVVLPESWFQVLDLSDIKTTKPIIIAL